MVRAGVVALLLLAGPAAAWSPVSEIWCLERAALEHHLSTLVKATRVGQGVRDPDSVMELWADPAGAWTMVVSYADGHACVVAMGEAWDAALPAVPAVAVAETGG